MPVSERLRTWFRRDRRGDHEVTSPPAAPAGWQQPTGAAAPADEPSTRPDEGRSALPDTGEEPDLGQASDEGAASADLLIANGHELLGPCKVCAGYWTRVKARGQKPLTCPVCKSET